MPQSIPFPQSSPSTDSGPPKAGGPDTPRRVSEPARPSVQDTPPEFPGCDAIPMTLREFERNQERLEFWDARAEIAWKVRDQITVHHEYPLNRLAVLASRIASVRGSPIECCGSVSLVRRESTGRSRWVMQPDQLVYLDWPRSRPAGRVIEVDDDTLPDVVLEVDHTTDVRRWKLKLYMECGFPELWVSVPHETSVRKPGLTIHLREGDGYVESPGEPGLPGLAGGGAPPRADRGAAFDEDVACPRASGARDGRARRDPARRRSPHPFPGRERAEGGPGRGILGWSSVGMPGWPPGRTSRSGARGAPRPGHRDEGGLRGRSGAARRPSARDGAGGGPRVRRRSRLPPTPPQRDRPLPAPVVAITVRSVGPGGVRQFLR